MIEVISPKKLNYDSLKHIKKGLILINPKHRDKALYEVKKWIFKKAMENYSSLQDDELIDFFLSGPKDSEEIRKKGLEFVNKVNELAKAQGELVKDRKFIIQYQGITWLDEDKIIIINK